jgi:hypothetical protein
MPFEGTAVVKQVSDRLVRVTGVSVPAGSAGAFSLRGFVPTPSVGPDLGAAQRFGILTPIYVNTNADVGTLIVGDLGYVTPPSDIPAVSGTIHVDDATYAQALADTAAALATLQALPATFSFAAGNVNLGTDATHGTAGTYGPGVYDVTGNATTSVGSTIHLSGPGLYVFRISGTLTTGANATIDCTNGADPAHVFWVVGGNVAIATANALVGTFMPSAASTMSIVAADDADENTLVGRMLGFSTTTTTQIRQVTVPLEVGAPVTLPAPFRPRTFAYLGSGVALQDSVQVTFSDVAQSGDDVPIAVVKTGTSKENFLATVYNTGQTQDTPLQEFYIRFHE